MKKIYTFLLPLFFLFVSSIPSAYSSQNFQIDPNHSFILFNINHFDFSHPTGKWMINKGTLTLDPQDPQKSQVNVVINVDKVITGIPELDKHLKGPLFFDVSKFPTATFKSDKVVLTGKDTAKVYGKLTLHGIAKPVTLDVKLNKLGVSPITEKETAGFTASTALKRSDFEIDTLLPGLGDDVNIQIEAEAIKS